MAIKNNTVERDYTVIIRESSRDLTAKEKIAFRDFGNAVKLDENLTEDDSMLIAPKDFVIIDVHNEKAKGNKDYVKYIIIDEAGTKYVTGSDSFFSRFIEIFETMREDAPDEPYQIEVYKRPSKNYAGKSFISCSLV